MLASDNGFQIALAINDADEANNHFTKMRKQDKEAYEAKINSQFGFEEA